MAAPSSTVWGVIAGGYGRIGIYKALSSTETQTTLSIQVWFWSKYSVSDSANTLYFNNLSAAGSATTSVGSKSISTGVQSGSGWDTANQQLIYSTSATYTRGTAASTRYLYAKLADVDRVGATMSVSTTATIPKLSSYTVSYNANGGSGAPSSQTKWYGRTLAISSTKPTRNGHSFQGWATSATGSVAYASGGSYTANAAVTLYAVWKATTYTVAYNANGGTGAPSSQTKTHGTALTLSSTKPTREKYTFKGWGTSASSTTVAYAAGASYTTNASITLYAIWELAYIKPSIFNLTASRCDSTGAATDDGTYGLIRFEWKSTYSASSITIAWASSGQSGSKTVTASGTSGTVNEIVGDGALSSDLSYTITVTVADSGGSSDAKTTLNGSIFPIDVLAGGKGVSIGKPAELGESESLGGNGVADFAFDAKFNEPVYGKALGMDRLPAIPSNSDLNDYMEPGCYAVQSNAIAETCSNIPVTRAGRLEVWSATGEGIRLEQWSYLRQRFIPYNSANAVWEREVTRGSDNVWNYYEWWKSSLTPIASEKVYSKAAATIVLGANTTLGVVNVYTTIPLNTLLKSTSTRLTMQSNAIRIGANIDFIKVSGQALIKYGSTAGNRHVRIQKVSSSGATTSIAWDCVYGPAASNTLFPFTPIIVSVTEGDMIKMVFYTSDSADSNASGSGANGWQTYLTVEEL